MTRALVLLDIDANLIIDFVPDAIPITTVTASPVLALRCRYHDGDDHG
jgi:hypothetical protein